MHFRLAAQEITHENRSLLGQLSRERRAVCCRARARPFRQ